MGCCQSVPDSSEASDALVTRGSRPLCLDPIVWTATPPCTQSELGAQRSAFWDTAPSYEGRREVWAALHTVATHLDDLGFCRTILDTAQITLPTGRLTDGCYDALGTRYILPAYVLFPPKNLINERTRAKRGASGGGGGGGSEWEREICVRLTTNHDVRVHVKSGARWRDVVEDVCRVEGVERSGVVVRLFRLGRAVLLDTRVGETIAEKDVGVEGVAVQAMLTPVAR